MSQRKGTHDPRPAVSALLEPSPVPYGWEKSTTAAYRALQPWSHEPEALNKLHIYCFIVILLSLCLLSSELLLLLPAAGLLETPIKRKEAQVYGGF